MKILLVNCCDLVNVLYMYTAWNGEGVLEMEHYENVAGKLL